MTRSPPRPVALVLALAVALVTTACAEYQKKKAEEASKDTFACQLNGERLVLKFTDGEARMLMPNAQRVTLYQLPSASGVRYSNGMMELRGKGMELSLMQHGATAMLEGCVPYVVPPAK